MRVHLVGNTCNNHFDLARPLRELGVDAHLYLTPADQRHPQTLPESTDPSLARGYPPWIHRLEFPLARMWHRGLVPARVRDELADCDLIHTHGNYAVWTMGKPTPFVIHPFGGDFFVMPYGRPPRSWTKLEDLVPDLRWVGFARQLREAYHRSSAVILGNVDHLWERAYRDLIPGRRVAPIGLAIDTATFAPVGGDAPPRLTELRARHELILFQPTRQIWTAPGRRENGDYSYGNDMFFRGLARAVRDGASACAVLVDKGSTCTTASKRLIAALGIERHVVWIPGMPRHELVQWYGHADLTVDAFYAGGFGSAALEAMSCGCPVLMAFDEEANRRLTGEIAPVVNAATEDEIAEQIAAHASATGRAALQDLGDRARGFILRHHARAAVVPRYRALYRTILGHADELAFVDPGLFLRLRSPLPPARRMPFFA